MIGKELENKLHTLNRFKKFYIRKTHQHFIHM